jgi:hypothetical protein
MKYWIDLFSWKTWQEFLEADGNISGFRQNRWSTVRKIKSGDLLLCYMTGISRFFAILEVTGSPFQSDEPIWEDAVFPCRMPVKVILSLEPEYAVPVVSLSNELSYFQNMKTPHSWSGHFRGSPTSEKPKDAEIIIRALEEAHQNPEYLEYDHQKLHRKSSIYETSSGTVSIPENSEQDEANNIPEDTAVFSHEAIQGLLLHIGQEMGLDLWVARNDRNRSFGDNDFGDFSRLKRSLPIQFDEATNRTIELIDVLWLQGNSIIAAFEIEHTSSVYSGLLRMADLVTMQPNIDIPLFIVAPDDRRDKVQREINRPVFTKALKKSLPDICRYISYSALKEAVDRAETGGFLRHLKPEYFFNEIAEPMHLED